MAAELGAVLRLTRHETAVRMAAALEVGRSFTEQKATPRLGPPPPGLREEPLFAGSGSEGGVKSLE